MKKVFTISTAAAVLLILLGGIFGVLKFIGINKSGPVFQKGMCYTTWSKVAYSSSSSDKSLEKLKAVNAEWVAVITTWYQDNCFSTDIFPTSKTPSDESVIHAIDKAHSLGFKVMLKPHLDLLSVKAGGWRGEITCVRETDWEKWFDSYRKFILHYAKIANEKKVEMLCVGTELTGSTADHPEQWREIIKAVRKAYRGKLVYAANWQDEYLQIRFWDALDYAGIDAYFPLSGKERPSYEELVQAWERWVPEIENWQNRIQKPVIFPEIGYRSSISAASQPWEHVPGPAVDLELQRDCYKAIVDTFWDKEWFYGAYWWSWGTDERMGGNFNRGFTPQNKPAQDYIEELYKKRINK
ncbi:MAG: glycoside hydrolase [Candidatus Omnitrophica bacterium]|nr:glycoside hydrolase [Candidatus Omnitrophota bacterium]